MSNLRLIILRRRQTLCYRPRRSMTISVANGLGAKLAREFAKSFYKSRNWETTQAYCMSRPIYTSYGVVPPYMCELCFEHGLLKPAKVVHHKIHLSPENINDPKISLDPANLQRLCQDCHALVHSKRTEPIRCSFDENGNPIPSGNDWLY